MLVRLRWADENSKAHDTLIYRSDTQPTSEPTGEPLVKLSNGELYWDDTTVVRGNTYWYTFVVANKTNRIASPPVMVTALPRTGHGPQELIWGDEDWGIYGHVTPVEFITHEKLAEVVGAPGSLVTSYIAGYNSWMKFARNGKVLFVPRRPITYGIPWSDLYAKGLVFGVSGPVPHSDQAPGVDQRTVIQIGGDQYIVRLPTGFDDRNNPDRLVPPLETDGFSVTNGGPYRKYSEQADLFWSIIDAFPVDRNRSMSGLIYISSPHTGLANTGGSVVTQELNINNRSMYLANSFSAATDVSPYSRSTSLTARNSYNSCGWWPVLELVETLEVTL